jgi:hypothetical protein
MEDLWAALAPLLGVGSFCLWIAFIVAYHRGFPPQGTIKEEPKCSHDICEYPDCLSREGICRGGYDAEAPDAP